MNQIQHKTNIYNRLLQEAASVHGNRNTKATIGAMDPLVKMLFGACATEFEKNVLAVNELENRLFNRLSEQLLPDTVTGVKAAHALLHLRPQDANYQLNTETDVFSLIEKENETLLKFTPVAPTKVQNTAIKYLISNKGIFHLSPTSKEEITTETPTNNILTKHPNRFRLLVELSEKITILSDFSICFQLLEVSEKDQKDFYTYLPLSQCAINGKVLSLQSGFPITEGDWEIEDTQPFEAELGDKMKAMEQQILGYYKQQFLHIPEGIPLKTKPLEESLQQLLVELKENKKGKQFICLDIELPSLMPKEIVEKVLPATNVVPIVNRWLEEVKTPSIPIEKGKSDLLPLDIQKDTHLLAIKTVQHIGGRYRQKALQKGTAGVFALRSRATVFQQKRQMLQLMKRLQHLMQDDYESLWAELKDDTLIPTWSLENWNHFLNGASQHLQNKGNSTADKQAFELLLKHQQSLSSNTKIHATYWCTNATTANDINTQTPLIANKKANWQKGSIQLVSPTIGGRNALTNFEHQQVLKSHLLSRQKLQTLKDIEYYCKAQLGDLVKEVEVCRGVAIGGEREKGIVRVVEVFVKANDGVNLQEVNRICKASSNNTLLECKINITVKK